MPPSRSGSACHRIIGTVQTTGKTCDLPAASPPAQPGAAVAETADGRWLAFFRAYQALQAAVAADDDPLDPLKAVFACAVRSAERPPVHLSTILDLLLAFDKAGRPRDSVTILDHGSGGGMTVLYLMALGYTGVRGIDLGGGSLLLNRGLRALLRLDHDPFQYYDGRSLPFEAGHFDLALSQQVLEHVPDDCLDAYYGEQVRVLKPAGLSVHQLPHRMMLYDSHLRLWLAHWLPRSWYLAIVRMTGRNIDMATHHLFLRPPGLHFRNLRARYRTVRDTTGDRIANPAYGDTGLRGRLRRVAAAPIVKPLAMRVLTKFMVIETVAVK